MEELTEEDNSGNSETTQDEQISEKDEQNEDLSDDSETPVIDPSEDSGEDSDADSVEEPTEDTETEAPEEISEEETKTPDEEVADGDKLTGVTPDALIPTDLKVEAKEPNKSEDAATNPYTDLTSAKITYTNGCVSDGGEIRAGVPITFKVDPADGKVLKTVQYETKGTDENAKGSGLKALSADGEGTYEIPVSALTTKVDGKDVNNVNVTIVVTTDDVKYTLKSNNASGYKVYLTKETDDGKIIADTAKEVTASGLADKITYEDSGKSVSFAVVPDSSVTTKVRSVTVWAGDSEKVLSSEANTEDTVPAPIYTFAPSADLADLDLNNDQEIVIAVDATAAAVINITKDLEGAVLGAVANADALYKEPNEFVNGNSASSAAEGQKIVFTAAAEGNYRELTADDVTAALNGTAYTVTPVAAQVVEGTTAKDVPAHYMIDLSDVTEDSTLVISVKTELDGNNKAVKSVDFSSISENSVTVTNTSDGNVTGQTKKTTTSYYEFDATAKPGYKIYRVEAVYDKEYEEKADGTTPETVTGHVENLTKDILPEVGLNKVVLGRLPEIEDLRVTFSGTDETGTWSTRAVAVKVYTELDAVEEKKTVYFSAAYDYDVATSDVITTGNNNNNNEYIVNPGADFLTFTVNAVTKPIVTASDYYGESIVGEPEKTEEGYVYQIAASVLDRYQYIYIRRDRFDIAVNYDSDNVTAEVLPSNSDDEIYPDEYDEEGRDIYWVDADSAYRFIIEADNDTTQIAKVTYTVGEDEPQEVNVRTDGSYVFSVDVTGSVEVNVETADAYTLVVEENEKAVNPDNKKVYNVSHASVVTAQLLNGSNRMPLFNADVKDGGRVAATIARIKDNVVTLEFDSSEYNKELTVELTLDDKARTKQSFKVKTTNAAAEVTLAGVKNSKVELPVDTQAAYKITVKTNNANLTGLMAKVVPADDTKKADNNAIKAAQDAVGAAIDEDGNLVITAKPAMTGTADAAKVIIVDGSSLTDTQKAALNVDNALNGGIVTVSTKDATIAGQAPTVKLVSTTDTTIKVQLGVPKGVIDPVEGKLYYKVELEIPAAPTFPEGVSDAQKAAITAALTSAATDWNTKRQYQDKADIDEKGGLLEIPVMKFTDANVEAGLNKGALLSGFSVKVTLLQTLAANGVPSAAATTITGGEASLTDIATKNPYYEIKLGLKKGTTTLITGQNKDVVVATPVFNKLTSYSSVRVQFVDTSTGEERGESWGESAEYGGMYAEYDETANTVTVNARDSWYYDNVDNGYYKNLGIKVTAYAEDSAYGAVATQKLTVVNGIQEINPTAPPEIYKAGKAVSFTIATDLNGSNSYKKYAPKSKKLDYQIVGPEVEWGYEGELSADLKANVSVKNGKVTIAKGYVVQPKAVQNQFRVKVSALDGTETVDYTDNITITSEGLQMGEIAVFSGSSLKSVSPASIEATQRSDEYTVRVLAPGVKTTQKYYSRKDYIDPSHLTFKSSNAKSVDIDKYGNLKILKAAKNVKITAVPKDGSNPKPVKTLVLTVSQVSAATPLLRITRYEDSTLNKETELYVGGTATINYNGNSTNNYFKLEVVKAVGEGDDTHYENFYLANYSISYKGAKQISKDSYYDGDYYDIVANAADTTITLKNKAVKNSQPVIYKLHNEDFVTDKNAKAPKIATTAKLAQGTGARNVYYTVKGAKGQDFTDKYVMLSVDRTKKNPDDIEYVFRKWDDEEYEYESELDKPLPILLGAGFNLYVNTRYVGNYNLVATVGSVENGVFKPEYKDAKVVVKIAKAKAASLSATGNYTLSLKSGDGAYIKYKSGNGWATFTNTSDENGNYAKNAIINGQENHFTDYFEVKEDWYGGMYVELKDTLPLTAPADKPDAPALDKIASNDYKNDRIGYISINNGSKYIDVKLTITIKDYTTDKTKYKATAGAVLEGPNAVTNLTILEGKAPVDAAYILAVSDAGFKPIYDEAGNLYLTATNLPAGNHKVDLYVVPWTAPRAYRDAVKAAANASDADKIAIYGQYGVKTSLTVKAAAKTTKNKIALVNKGSNTWNVADTDYNPAASWSRVTPFSLKNKLSLAETADITIAASVNNAPVDYVSFELADKKWMKFASDKKSITYMPASYPMEIKLDKEKLAAKIAADNAEGSTVARSKRLNWGKTVSVKATFTYSTDASMKDELTFKIKLPANAGADDAAVTGALNDAFTRKLQSDIETYTRKLEDEYGDYADYYAEEINSEVRAYIRSEINKAIKGAAVTVAISDNGGTGENTVIANEWKVAVNSTDASKTKLYDETFKIIAPMSGYAIAHAIDALGFVESAKASNEIRKEDGTLVLKVTSTTTGAELASALRERLGQTATRNISLTAVPTVREVSETEQWIEFELTIKDLFRAPQSSSHIKHYRTITFRLSDRQKEKLDKMIENYLKIYATDIAEIKQFKDPKYADNEFSVKVDPTDKTDVRKTFEDWEKTHSGKAEEYKNQLVEDLKETFGDEWEEVDSITVKVTARVAGKEENRTRTIQKEAGESIESFADKYYNELNEQRDRILEKYEEIVAEKTDKGYLAFGDLNGVNGDVQTTVNFGDGSGVSETFTYFVEAYR